MLTIIGKNYNGADFLLSDGTMLFCTDWNGEIYINGYNDGDTNRCYRPVYDREITEDYEGEYNIIGFEDYV